MGIPMQVKAISGLAARCEAKGVEREVSLLMLDPSDVTVGDFVVVHLGHALEKVSAERAAEAWAVYDEMLAAGAQDSPGR
jgi:hydrogenase expression/formation protein HypC